MKNTYQPRFLSWATSYESEVMAMRELIFQEPSDVKQLKEEYLQLTGKQYRKPVESRPCKKIDLYFNGDYLCSTNQSRTCREAVKKYIDSIEMRTHSLGGIGLLDSQIRKNPKGLKAYFDKKAV